MRDSVAFRGGDGPIATRKSRYQDPLVDAYLQAAAASGHKLNDDYNAERQDGFSRMQMTIRNGRRESAATAYLHPVRARKNLKVTVRAQDVLGKHFEITGEELLARAFLHETDHLNGKLYISHLSALKRDLMKRKIRKLMKAGEW